MTTIQQRLEQIIPRIKSDGFFEGRRLGNELNFHIFDYNPKDEMIVREYIEMMKRKLNKEYETYQVIEVNLYQAIIDILNTKGFLEKNFEFEDKKGSEFVFDKTRKALRLTLANDLLVNYIKERVEPHHIVLMTGVGQAYPIIRSHSILNNLHHVLDQNPLIMFFPGRYDGQSLSLFNLIKDDNYYRAFRLVD